MPNLVSRSFSQSIALVVMAACSIQNGENSMAQETSYLTFEQASADALVVELLGENALDQLQETYREQAAQRRISSALSDGIGQYRLLAIAAQ
jgi:hypothetical protein